MTPYRDSYWIFKEEYKHKDFSWENYMNNIALVKYHTSHQKETRKIYQYSTDRVFIREWESLAEIRKVYEYTSSICSVLHHSRGKKTAYGFIWTYEDYDFSDGYFDSLDENRKGFGESRKRKVAKVNPVSYDILCTYDSLKEAASDNDIHNTGNITYAAKTYPYHTCKGYLWKYIE